MDRLLLSILVFGFVSYIIGVIFAQKTISALFRFFSFLKGSINIIEEFIKSQGDRIFLFFILSIPIATYYFFHESLELDKLIQFLIVEGTFFAVIYSVLIKDNSSKYRNRPIIDVYFNDGKSYCYHKTTLYDTVRMKNNESINFAFETYYVSVEVLNKGATVLENVEVVLHKVESEKSLINPFLPLNLQWSFKGESLSIPPHKMSRLINIIEVREPNATRELLSVLRDKSGVWDEDRYLELSKGFRSCTVKPNTLSDIFPVGKYIFYLTVTASNAKPKSIKMKIEYDGNWDKSTSLEDMRSMHLKVAREA